MAGGERRKEPRYVVDAVNIKLNGSWYPVIDISASGARLSCSPRVYASAADAPLELEFNRENRRDVYVIRPRLIRLADLYVVIGYDPPRSDWATFIRQFDTFHVHELDEELFG